MLFGFIKLDQALGKINSTSDTTLSGQEYRSVTTPCLVSSLCQLIVNLLNLAPQDTLICLNKETVIQTLIRYLLEVVWIIHDYRSIRCKVFILYYLFFKTDDLMVCFIFQYDRL